MTFLLLAVGLLLCATATLVSAHVCMFQPPQRGPFNLNQPGDDTCFHIGPDPCGNQTYTGGMLNMLTAGEAYEVEFQQQLNHWFGGKPGFLRLDIAFVPTPAESDFTYLFGSVIPDMPLRDQIAIQNYTMSGTLPTQTCNHGVLRLTYSPNNPDEPTFHQCSDIMIMAPGSKGNQHHKKHPTPVAAPAVTVKPSSKPTPARSSIFPAASPPDCCAFSEFEAVQTFTGNAVLPSGVGKVAYSTELSFIYFSIFDPNSQRAFQHYMNLTYGWEWMWARDANGVVTCVPTYSDQLNPWCYGVASNMAFSQYDQQGNSVWTNPYAGWTWTVNQQENQCLPVQRVRQGPSGQQTIQYSNVMQGIQNPIIFNLPGECPPNPSNDENLHLSALSEHHASLVKEVRSLISIATE